jgi:hypothetical protein
MKAAWRNSNWQYLIKLIEKMELSQIPQRLRLMKMNHLELISLHSLHSKLLMKKKIKKAKIKEMVHGSQMNQIEHYLRLKFI